MTCQDRIYCPTWLKLAKRAYAHNLAHGILAARAWTMAVAYADSQAHH